MAFLGQIRRAAVELGGVTATTWVPLSRGHPWAALTKAPRPGFPSPPLPSIDLRFPIRTARPPATPPPAPALRRRSSSETARSLSSSIPSPHARGLIETAIAGTPASPSAYGSAGTTRSLPFTQDRHSSMMLRPWSRSFSQTVKTWAPPPIASTLCISRYYSTWPEVVLPEMKDSREPPALPHYRSDFNPRIIHREARLIKTTRDVIAVLMRAHSTLTTIRWNM